MIVTFADRATEDLYNGVNSREARKACPRTLWKIAGRKLDQLDSVTTLEELRIPPGNRLEALRGDRDGQHGVRISSQYRICFRWTDNGPSDLTVADYH